MTEEQRKPKSAEPTPELPDEGADLEPQAQPLTHHEPDEAHTAEPVGSTERARADTHVVTETHAMGEATPEGHVDEHAADIEHGHEEARLGPVDWPAWGYVLVGVAVSLAVVIAFWLAAY